MNIFYEDLRLAFANLRRNRRLTAAVVLILGLGMGAATAVVDVFNLLAWRKIPVESPNELVKIFTAAHRGFISRWGFNAYPDYLEYRDAAQSFRGLAAHREHTVRLDTGQAVNYEQIAAVSGNFFEVLGLDVVLGRPLGMQDDLPGASLSTVITDRMWQRLGADPEILGTILRLEGHPFVVVGVSAPPYKGLAAGMVTELFVPISALPVLAGQDSVLTSHRGLFSIIGRLLPGRTRSMAQAEVELLAQRLDRERPLPDGEPRRLSTAAAQITLPIDRERFLPSLGLFAGAVLVLLLVTCTNVAHLLLAHSTRRHREMAVRQVIGASRLGLVRQLLMETLLLAFLGGLCGLVLASWARGFLAAYVSPEFAGEMRFDGFVLGIGFLVCLLVTLLSGLVPAWTASRVSLSTALKSGGGSAGRATFGQWLAAIQIGLCVALLGCGALLLESLRHRLDADLGFDSGDLVIANLELPSQEYSPERGQLLFRQLQERAASLPGASAATTALISPPILFDISVPLKVPEDPENPVQSRINYVDGHYFDTLDIPFLDGRTFRPADGESNQGVVIVNQPLAERFWPGEDPIGRTIRLEGGRDPHLGPDYTVVGVVGGVRQFRSAEGLEPVLYFSSAQRYRWVQKLIIRTTVDPTLAFDSMRSLLRELDPNLAFQDLRTGEKNRRDAYLIEQMQVQAVTIFAVVGWIVALTGIFGVASYEVGRRTREIGIRMALGARRRDVRWRVVRRGMVWAVGGILLGWILTSLAAGFLRPLLFGIGVADKRIWLGVVASVLIATEIALYLPARRASRLDPQSALRED